MAEEYVPNPALVFKDPPAESGALVFGAGDSGGSGDYAATIEVKITSLAPSMAVALVELAELEVSLTGGLLVPHLETEWDENVDRPLAHEVTGRHQIAVQLSVPTTSRHQIAVQLQSIADDRIESARRISSATTGRHQQAAPLDSAVTGRHQIADNLQNQTTGRHQDALNDRNRVVTGRHQDAGLLTSSTRGRQQDALRDRYRVITGRHQDAAPTRVFVSGGFQSALPFFLWVRGRHQDAMSPPPGRSRWGPVIPPHTPCYIPNAALLFSKPWAVNGNLLFVCETHGPGTDPDKETVRIPWRKVYVVINSASLVRVSDGAEIGLKSASVSIDYKTWCWGLTATIQASDLDKVRPISTSLTEVELDINGFKWRFLVEGFGRTTSFNSKTVQIRGSSVTLALHHPLSARRSFIQETEMTSVQYAQQELERSDIEIDFELDWGLVDPTGWILPAGAYNYQNLSAIEVIRNIAQGVGGYVNSHPFEPTLLVRSAYPTLPWEWPETTPDIELPEGFLRVLGETWRNETAWNGVYAAGQTGGVLVKTYRSGTIGNLAPPPYVNPMITSMAAGQEYGRSILGAGGPQIEVRMASQLSEMTSLFSPGKLIEVTTDGDSWFGMVRGVAVNMATDSRSGLITVEQQATLERHYEE